MTKLSEEEKNKQEILKVSFTSLYHWEEVGNDENKYLGYLAVARALTINNVSDFAFNYVKEAYDCFSDTDQNWIRAFINATLSHVLLIKGDVDEAGKYY